MWFQTPFILGLATQLPFISPPRPERQMDKPKFAFKEDPDRFTPRDLVELGRPGTGKANDAGDLIMVSYSQFNLSSKESVQIDAS